MSNNKTKEFILPDFLKFDLSIFNIFDLSSQTSPKSNSINLYYQECPICFSAHLNPTRPNNCTHIFCFECLYKWSLNSSKCPYCRQVFNKIIKL